MVCEHRINYAFLLEMPTNKVSVGFRRTFIIGLNYLVFCNICILFIVVCRNFNRKMRIELLFLT